MKKIQINILFDDASQNSDDTINKLANIDFQHISGSRGMECISLDKCYKKKIISAGPGSRVFLDWDKTIEYLAWPDAPKYRTLTLSKLIDNPDKYLSDKTHCRVTLDVSITYEEANFIKETFIKQYNLREIVLMPSKKEEHTQDWNKGVDIQVENVDSIVLSQLNSVQSDTIKKQLLVDIYRGLTT